MSESDEKLKRKLGLAADLYIYEKTGLDKVFGICILVLIAGLITLCNKIDFLTTPVKETHTMSDFLRYSKIENSRFNNVKIKITNIEGDCGPDFFSSSKVYLKDDKDYIRISNASNDLISKCKSSGSNIIGKSIICYGGIYEEFGNDMNVHDCVLDSEN